MENIAKLRGELDRIAAQKADIESRLADAIESVIGEESADSPKIKKRLSGNAFVVSARDFIDNVWSPTYFDNSKAADIIKDFARKCGAQECREKLQELLDSSDGRTVYFNSSRRGCRTPVDADLIRKILDRI